MDIHEKLEEIIDNETGKQIKPIRELVKKEILRIISAKSFKKKLIKEVEQSIWNSITENGPFSFLSESEENRLMKKAVQNIFKPFPK